MDLCLNILNVIFLPVMIKILENCATHSNFIYFKSIKSFLVALCYNIYSHFIYGAYVDQFP